MNQIISQAQEYARQGWHVYPVHSVRAGKCSCAQEDCKNPGKHPRIKNWTNECSAEASQIIDWWRQWPDANIGIATGEKSDLLVLDVDKKHGGYESLEKLISENGPLDKALVAKSGGGGLHFYFQYPSERIANRVGLLPGLDIRGEGGSIVAPPSIHASGNQYSWTTPPNREALVLPPDWLLSLITQPKHLHVVPQGHANEGERNNYLTQEAGKMRRVGLSSTELENELQRINQDRCSPPLSASEVTRIATSIARYPGGSSFSQSRISWPNEPDELPPLVAPVPMLSDNLIPPLMRPWILDVAERMQVTPEFVVGPALVALSAVVGRKIGIHPKQQDDWLVVPNLWGAIVARPGYFKSPTIAEALKPLERLSDEARKEFEQSRQQMTSAQTVSEMQLEAVKDLVKRAIKDGNQAEIDRLRERLEEIEKDHEGASAVEKRYKTNDATVEKVARLLNDNPNGILLLRDELNGWLQSLNKAGREGDREFYLEAWNGYGSYTVDRIGSGTLHVPALCLSIFGGIQPGKLQAYVEKAMRGSTEDDGLMQRFQVLIYPDVSFDWENIDRVPDFEAREEICRLFKHLDNVNVPGEEDNIPSVRFSKEAQEIFNTWRARLEKRLRSGELECQAFESHLAKYRSLMPSLALLFWILEDQNNIAAKGNVSASATLLATQWCDFLEKHAAKVYFVGEANQTFGARTLAAHIEKRDLFDNTPVRSIYRKQWRGLRTPEEVDQALEILEELNWVRVVKSSVQGGATSRIFVHPKFQARGGEHGSRS